MRGKYDVSVDELMSAGGRTTSTIKPVFGPTRLRPRISLLSLDKRPWFDETYGSLLKSLRSKATVEEITDFAGAVTLLSTNSATTGIILVTDAAISHSANACLKPAAARFVRAGGTVIFMGHFPSFVPPPDLKSLFNLFGLAWEQGNYFRETHLRNPLTKSLDTRALARTSSQKSLCLHNVDSTDAVYASPYAESTETAVAFATVGRGKVGYIGDVNAEDEMGAVVLAMCGLAP